MCKLLDVLEAYPNNEVLCNTQIGYLEISPSLSEEIRSGRTKDITLESGYTLKDVANQMILDTVHKVGELYYCNLL